MYRYIDSISLYNKAAAVGRAAHRRAAPARQAGGRSEEGRHMLYIYI